jgi:hypothetical protein
MMEDDKFLAFVEDEAKKIGKIFILDSGEGNEIYNKEKQMEGEDLSGWLIDEEQRKSFIEYKKAGNEYKNFEENYIFAKWQQDEEGKLSIEFQKY